MRVNPIGRVYLLQIIHQHRLDVGLYILQIGPRLPSGRLVGVHEKSLL